MKKLIVLLMFVWMLLGLGITVNAQTDWNSQLHLDWSSFDIPLKLELKDSTFEAFSDPKAVIRTLGVWKGNLARLTMKKFKAGSLLRVFRGKVYRQVHDTAWVEGALATPFQNYNLKGYCTDSILDWELSNGNHKVKGSLKGHRSEGKPIPKDYSNLVNKLLEISEEKLYNPKLLTRSKWKGFKRKIRKVGSCAKDDVELLVRFFILAKKLPFSHYAMVKKSPKTIDSTVVKSNKYLEQKELADSIAYLKVKSFSGTKEEVILYFDTLLKKNYTHLIIDLRDNSGGSIESGMQLVRYLVDASYYGGVFLTQRWFNQGKEVPEVSEYPTLTQFSDASFDLIIKGIHKQEGLCLRVDPAKQTYKGQLFILANKNTASTCESIIHCLKQYGLATIVGETTAGAMLNGELFDLIDGFNVFIPTADYYAADGYRIDKKGVKPNYKVKAEKALEYTLKLIQHF
ncbi:MAG: hypothetical protein GY810_23585 [Aureispira sp.]|nr:hypothetical protein [Aureispira sp.]